MTILDGMLPPPKARNDALERLIEMTCQRVHLLDNDELARLAAHEHDEEVVAPEPGSAGAAFLRDTARVFTGWLSREGRFPDSDEADAIAGELVWQSEQPGSRVAQAFVDLGLYYSQHADVARGATRFDLERVLAQAASTLIFTLVEEYAPLV
jgi:hypothetical protein